MLNDGANIKTLNIEVLNEVHLTTGIRDVAPSLKVSIKFQDISAKSTKKGTLMH